MGAKRRVKLFKMGRHQAFQIPDGSICRVAMR